MVPRVLQLTENELCLEHGNHTKTLSWSPRKICVLLCFQSFLCTKHQIFFFKLKVLFIQGAFKNIQGLGRNFKDFSRITNKFSIQGLFKDMTLFRGLFRARANHVSVNIENNAEKDMTFFSSKSPGPSKLNLELHLGCHTGWLSCFLLVCLWFRQSGGRTVIWLSKFIGYNDLSASIQCVNVFLTGGVKRALQNEKKSLQDRWHSGQYFLSFLFIIAGVWKSTFCGQRLVGHHDALLSFQLWHLGCRAQNCWTSWNWMQHLI